MANTPEMLLSFSKPLLSSFHLGQEKRTQKRSRAGRGGEEEAEVEGREEEQEQEPEEGLVVGC